MLRRQEYQWSAGGSHPIRFRLWRCRWPPFYSTAFFTPRLQVVMTNDGDDLGRTTLGVYVAEHEGPIGDAPARTDGWDVLHHEFSEPWPRGDEKRVTLRLPARGFPKPGTYVARLTLTRWIPLKSPYEQMMDSVEDLPECARAAHVESSLRLFRERGIDPHAEQPGACGGDGIHAIALADYFRVEPFSSVLTFWVVIGTLMTAMASLVVAVAALVS